MPPRLVILGSSNTDLVIRCAELPRPGETTLGGEFAQFAGGKGANQAVAAARAGARVMLIGACGDDEFGRSARRGLRAAGSDLRYFKTIPGASSGVALILLGGKTRENLIAVARSANDQVNAEQVSAATAAIDWADAVVAQLEVPISAVERAAELAGHAGKPFILNPAPSRPLPKRLLRLVHTLTPNETEARQLSGGADLNEAIRMLRRRGCRQVVVTLGAKGVLCGDANGIVAVPAPRVQPVDTVGAGDCFTGWLAVGIAEGRSLIESAERAVRAASLAVTRPGAQAGMPGRTEVA